MLPVTGLITKPNGPGAVGILLPIVPPLIPPTAVVTIRGISKLKERGFTSVTHKREKARLKTEGSSGIFCRNEGSPVSTSKV